MKLHTRFLFWSFLSLFSHVMLANPTEAEKEEAARKIRSSMRARIYRTLKAEDPGAIHYLRMNAKNIWAYGEPSSLWPSVGPDQWTAFSLYLRDFNAILSKVLAARKKGISFTEQFLTKDTPILVSSELLQQDAREIEKLEALLEIRQVMSKDDRDRIQESNREKITRWFLRKRYDMVVTLVDRYYNTIPKVEWDGVTFALWDSLLGDEPLEQIKEVMKNSIFRGELVLFKAVPEEHLPSISSLGLTNTRGGVGGCAERQGCKPDEFADLDGGRQYFASNLGLACSFASMVAPAAMLVIRIPIEFTKHLHLQTNENGTEWVNHGSQGIPPSMISLLSGWQELCHDRETRWSEPESNPPLETVFENSVPLLDIFASHS